MTNHIKKGNVLTALALTLLFSCNPGEQQKETATMEEEETEANVQLISDEANRKVDVMINGQHFTSYIYPEDMEKPVLYPIKTAKGTFVTRGFPLASRAGERVDHPHHVGLWFNYGDVNGLDFWNNSSAIAKEKKDQYGTIIHRDITLVENGGDKGTLGVTTDWVDSKGNVLLKEETIFEFAGTGNKRTIDRTTKLTAQDKPVSFTDNKEGMLGMRMARQLEHPSEKAEKFTDANGIPTDVPTLNNEGVTGMYRGSNGLTGNDVWGSRSPWMNLSGTIEGEDISVAILDHPNNVGYPTYWHARGYGLYAANTLGQKAMSEGKEELNFKLDAGESVTFKYRIVVYSNEEVSDEVLNKEAEAFGV